MSEFSVRRAVAEDLDQVLHVLRAALGETPLVTWTREQFWWKHRDNPFGESLVLLATDGDDIAGVRALMRWTLTTPEGHELKCMRPVDTATNPAYMRRGVFRLLTLHSVDIARSEGVDLIFNTPNDASAPGYLSMGWKHVGWLDAQVRPRLGSSVEIDATSVPKRSVLLDGVPEVPSLSVDDRRPSGLRTPRTDSYLQWRFTKHPRAEYAWMSTHPGRGAVLRPSRRGGRSEVVVADLLGGADHQELKLAAERSRARYLATWFSKRSPERKAATRAGFVSLPWVRSLRLVAHCLSDLDHDPFDLRSWDLAVSDLELF